MDAPARNEVAQYRDGTTRRELLDEVSELAEALPNGDQETAQRALATIQGPVMNRDLRYAAGAFYVLQADRAWQQDSEAEILVAGLLQEWCDIECRTLETIDRQLRAAWAANEAAGGDQAWGERYQTVREKFKKEAARWRGRVQALPVRERVRTDLKSMPGVAVPEGPEAFDANPEILAVRNGVVDLRTGQLRALRAGDLVTQVVDVEYDPAARAPQWERFLGQVLVDEEGITDPALVQWLQRFIGYSITGHAREQVFAVFYGSGANGKGVIIETLTHLFSSISRTTPMSTFGMGNGNGGGASSHLARLAGARMVFTSEGEVGELLSASTIKRVTGEDRITARFLYRPEFEFMPKFTLIMASNTKPHVRDSSEGYWRRVKLVPFRRYFSPGERDSMLKMKLRAEEAGILAWAVRGAQEWLRHGLSSAASVDAETESYRATSDRLAEFIRDCLDITGAATDVVTMKAVWLAYSAWAMDNKEEGSMRRSVFTSAIGERRGMVTTVRHNQAVLRGVKLLDETEKAARRVASEKALRREGAETT